MLTPIRRRLTYANVMSSIAVFAVLGGGAYAGIDRKIRTADLGKNVVTTPKLAKQAVGTGKVKAQAIRRGKIADGEVRRPKIFDNAVNADKIENEAVVTDKLAPAAVEHGKIADGAVNSEKVGEIVKRVGSTVVPNNANGTANATCLGGERLLSGGGGFLGGEMDAQVSFSGQVGGAGNWRVHARNESGAPRTLEAQVHCLQ
jgi:hypothetical protein